MTSRQGFFSLCTGNGGHVCSVALVMSETPEERLWFVWFALAPGVEEWRTESPRHWSPEVGP